MKKFLVFIIFLFSYSANAELCQDFQLLDGSEPIVEFGMDTTQHWWAITSPFANTYRLVLDDEQTDVYQDITKPIFAPDGLKWACFGLTQTGWELITNDTIIELNASSPGEIAYSPQNCILVYSYFVSSLEYIVIGNKKIEAMHRNPGIIVSDNGKFVITGSRGTRKTLLLNGNETTTFDNILYIGFMHDGSFMYAAQVGTNWGIYRDNRLIMDNFLNVSNPCINKTGTIAAVIVQFATGYAAVTFNDEYTEPQIGKIYDQAGFLKLHPSEALIAYRAVSGITNYIIFNSAEYIGGKECGEPFFTYDGEEMYFIGKEFDSFVSINGLRYELLMDMHVATPIAVKPRSNTIAYTSSSSLMLKYLGEKRIHSGMMTDKTSIPRFNRFKNRYEALGFINNRLYLLTCSPD